VYVLVLFRAGSRLRDREQHAGEHEGFVTTLIEHNHVLLGGDFVPPVSDLHAAYVLRCASVTAALEIAARDPLFASRVYEPHAVEWDLVGINLEAIEPELT
jgi:uncharacterized protein YciI